jgi:hypothetical protein
MNQPLLFPSSRPAKRKSAQRENLERVRSGIGKDVLAFIRSRGVGAKFCAGELSAWVTSKHSCAPGSADRILRELRREGLLGYVVENRAQSRYRIVKV